MLTPDDFIKAAAIVGCDVAAIKAVTRTESGGRGFYGNGKPIIRFEGHLFHGFTGGKFDVSHPTLSYPHWTDKYSEYGPDAYNRFNQAFALDRHAAIMATSWGMFQILGENYSSCGFSTVDAFVTEMHLGERQQLIAFCTYVKIQGLGKWLIMLKQAPEAAANGFALRYNGSGYKKNNYDGHLVTHYEEALKES